jgi:tyrosine-protein kinase Etk/Wzc
VVINFIASDSIINATNFNFYINITSDVGFEYRVYEDEAPKMIAFGETIDTNFGGMVITPGTSGHAKFSWETIPYSIK